MALHAIRLNCLACQRFGERCPLDIGAGLSPCAVQLLFGRPVDCVVCARTTFHRCRWTAGYCSASPCTSRWCSLNCWETWVEALDPKAGSRLARALHPVATLDRQNRVALPSSWDGGGLSLRSSSSLEISLVFLTSCLITC